jgi:hypothetical protein
LSSLGCYYKQSLIHISIVVRVEAALSAATAYARDGIRSGAREIHHSSFIERFFMLLSSVWWLGPQILSDAERFNLLPITIVFVMGGLGVVIHDLSACIVTASPTGAGMRHRHRVLCIAAMEIVPESMVFVWLFAVADSFIVTASEPALVICGVLVPLFALFSRRRRYNSWQRKGRLPSMPLRQAARSSRRFAWAIAVLFCLDMLPLLYFRVAYLEFRIELPGAAHRILETLLQYQRGVLYALVGLVAAYVSLKVNERLMWKVLRQAGICFECGYDAHGLAACPECGVRTT